ncbi:MAG: hypothetical protein WBF00_13280, partial [Methylocella sp.]
MRPARAAPQQPKDNRRAHRRGKTKGKFGRHCGKVTQGNDGTAAPSWLRRQGAGASRLASGDDERPARQSHGAGQRLMGPFSNFRFFNG